MHVRCVHWRLVSVLLLVCGMFAAPASAQLVFESAGERALGMAGAFVAVADDATAVHWNPAGLAAGPFAGMTIGWHGFQLGNRDAGPGPGHSRGRSTLTSLGTLPVGISYGTTQRTWLSDGPSAGLPIVQSLRVSHLGVTVLQSVMDGLVLGSTIKVARGGLASALVDQETAEAALDAGADLEMARRTTLDFDFGAMASAPHVRVGVALKNLRSPSFRAAAGNEVVVPRQARLGVAVLPVAGVTLAMDLDLNTVDLMGDRRRNLALGGESALGGRIQVRSGVRWNLADDRRVVGTAGASVSVRRGMWIDGHIAAGPSEDAREWGVALRAGF